MILDTTFMIDLQREFRKGPSGPARRFLQNHPNTTFCLSVITVTEFLEGFNSITAGEKFIQSLPWIPVDAEIARKAAEFRRFLRHSGTMIGEFDLLIGSTAVVNNLPLVTFNARRFQRLASLQVIEY